MRRRQQKYKGMMGFVLIFLAMTSFPSKYEADKTIVKSFKVNPPATLYLDNEFGDIEISAWNKSEIEIEVEVKAYSGSRSNAEKFVKETNIDFSQEGKKVYARTKLGTRKAERTWLSWFRGSNQTYEVNYKVKIPELTNLDIENEHGDVYLEQYDGDLELDLSYGSIKAANITGSIDLALKHSEGKIQGLDNGDLELSFSEFQTRKAGNLNMKTTNSEITIPSALNLTIFSKYDEYQIGQMDNLVNEGAYDEFEIGKARSINITSRYTELSATVCEVGLEVDMTHGEVEINHISSAFDGGKLEGNDTDFDITFDGHVNIDVLAEYTSVDIGSTLTDLSEMAGGNKKHIKAYKGTIGNSQLLRGDLIHGSLKIR